MSCPIQTPATQVTDYAYHHGGVRPEVIGLIITATRVEVTLRERSSSIWLTNPPQYAPDRVWKEVYEVCSRPITPDGRLAWLELISKVEGRHEPAHEVAERVVFPGEATS